MPKRKVKKTLKKKLISPNVLKEAQSLPPQERKRYLKKFAISFAKGVAGAAGAAVTIGVIYKLSQKNIDNKINSTVRSATREGIDELKQQIPGVSQQVQKEAIDAITNVQPIANKMIKDAVTAGTEQGITKLKEHEGELEDLAENIAGAGVRGAQKNVQGPLSWIAGGGNKNEKEKNINSDSLPKSPPNQRERKNAEANADLILEGKRTKNQSKILDPSPSGSKSRKTTPKKIKNDDDVEQLNKQNAAVIKIQSKLRGAIARRNFKYKKEEKEYNKPRQPILGFIPNLIPKTAPIKGSLYKGIREVKFGKKKNKVRLSLKTMKSDLNKLKK